MLIATVTPSEDMKRWAVYEVINQNQECIFIYFGRYTELVNCKELLANSDFDPKGVYTLRSISVHEDRYKAVNAMSAEIQERGMPALNKTMNYNKNGAVLCNETGQVFESAAVAARSLGIDQPRLSNHLNRKPGHRSIKGLTFRYARGAELKDMIRR